MRIPSFFVAPVVAVAFGLIAPAAALAHVELAMSTPAAGSETKAPRTITLTFSQPVNQASAAAAIVMTAMPGVANHGEMPIRNFTADWSPDSQTMSLKLPKALASGTYDVRWQAAASDGHLQTGAVTFTVR
jgi:copper resistance protein C